MPRFPRVNLEGALYYITTKADYKLNLFREDSDKNRYLSFLFEYKNLYNFKLYSLVLTSTESHLLIEPSQQFTVSQIMHDVNANYTKYYNKKYEKKGHLFEERFKAVLIEKKAYLLEITRFIHRIILKGNSLTQLKDYRWSSYLSYLKMEQDKSILSNIDCQEVLSLLPAALEDKNAGYQDFVEKSENRDLEDFENKMYRASVVGSADFVEKIKEISKTQADAGQEQAEENAEVSLDKAKRSQLVYALSAFVLLVFLGTSIFFAIGGMDLKREIKEAARQKDEIFVKDLIATKQELSRELEEKYRADMVSYKVTAMRLQELEKKDKQKGEKL
ncbi:MAG: transposase [Candidatus Omnitrophica bacterium]|jgi:REP element-mobilizing transposase RayT|nr:transposase [Candidatus Omnitrophota bacterium]